MKPIIPTTFVYDIDWYRDWDKNLLADGWTKKNLNKDGDGLENEKNYIMALL